MQCLANNICQIICRLKQITNGNSLWVKRTGTAFRYVPAQLEASALLMSYDFGDPKINSRYIGARPFPPYIFHSFPIPSLLFIPLRRDGVPPPLYFLPYCFYLSLSGAVRGITPRNVSLVGLHKMRVGKFWRILRAKSNSARLIANIGINLGPDIFIVQRQSATFDDVWIKENVLNAFSFLVHSNRIQL
jgi:hypothetical protein